MNRTGRRKGNESLKVYETLREKIISGGVKPGSHLSQQALARAMGTSNGPVISALRRLTHEGLVGHIRGHGCQVTEWTDEEIEDKLVIRRALETEAARLVARRIGGEDLENLNQLVDGMGELVRKGKRDEASIADVKFHMAIAALTRSPNLQEALARCHLLEVVRRRLESKDGRVDFKNMVQNHRLLVEAIASGDPEKAAKAMHEHLRTKTKKSPADL